MEIYLNEQELQREESLFAPKKPKYKLLEGKACNIREFVEEVGQADNLPRPPSSC